jgi:serine/threonine-protein kinase HipA
MRTAEILQHGFRAGRLEELGSDQWRFTYDAGYAGEPVSLSMPVSELVHDFHKFPPPFEGLLPEGLQLEAMLRRYKLDRSDLLGQLLVCGEDLVGSLIVRSLP